MDRVFSSVGVSLSWIFLPPIPLHLHVSMQTLSQKGGQESCCNYLTGLKCLLCSPSATSLPVVRDQSRHFLHCSTQIESWAARLESCHASFQMRATPALLFWVILHQGIRTFLCWMPKFLLSTSFKCDVWTQLLVMWMCTYVCNQQKWLSHRVGSFEFFDLKQVWKFPFCLVTGNILSWSQMQTARFLLKIACH